MNAIRFSILGLMASIAVLIAVASHGDRPAVIMASLGVLVWGFDVWINSRGQIRTAIVRAAPTCTLWAHHDFCECWYLRPYWWVITKIEGEDACRRFTHWSLITKSEREELP